MVSTRGLKLKFYEGERVLCYEPDPTKAKVLYDSKVLDIVVNKDQRGRKTIEYLIHFQGWNSSWDRCVGEEFVLKDTGENRQLQKDLAEKSQLQLGAYLYRRERKKHRKNSDRVGHSSEDGSSGSPGRMDTDDGHLTSTSDEDSSTEDEFIPLEMTPVLKEFLEKDYYLISSNDKLHKLPAEPNVVTILETYFRHFYNNQICELNEKINSRYKSAYNQQKITFQDIQKNIRLCKEVMEGLRIYFDFTVNDLLLYKQEKNQVETSNVTSLLSVKNEIKREDEYGDYVNNSNSHLTNNLNQEDYNHNSDHDAGITRRRTLRSNTIVESLTNGHSHPTENSMGVKPPLSSTNSNSEASVNLSNTKSFHWTLLPDQAYSQQPAPPCLVYGATHLVRLLVKLPELLNASSISDTNLKQLLENMEPFVDFLSEHKEWFGDKYYINV